MDIKYPRTLHLEGSKGIQDPDAVPFSSVRGKHLVVEEKMDGSMVSIQFDDGGDLHIRHRNQDARGLEFDHLKRWINEIQNDLFDRLSNRYVMYGEWMFACHTIFYDNLPNLFLEYDVYDKENSIFLSTGKRTDLLFGMPIESVRVLDDGPFYNLRDLNELVTSSGFVSTNQQEKAIRLFESIGLRRGDALSNLDLSGKMEGLYIKHEDQNQVLDRYKYVRSDFIKTILRSEHWSDRPLVQNQLRCSST